MSVRDATMPLFTKNRAGVGRAIGHLLPFAVFSDRPLVRDHPGLRSGQADGNAGRGAGRDPAGCGWESIGRVARVQATRRRDPGL